MDVYERAQKDDLMEASVIMAVVRVQRRHARPDDAAQAAWAPIRKLLRAEEKPAGDKAVAQKDAKKVKKAAKKE